MNLENAIKLHSDWKKRFRDAIEIHGSFDVDVICRDNQCDLGKWLHGEAKAKLGHLKSYSQCVVKHAAFHFHAARVAQLINDANYVAAEREIGIGSAYTKASNAVGVAMIALKHESEQIIRAQSDQAA